MASSFTLTPVQRIIFCAARDFARRKTLGLHQRAGEFDAPVHVG